MALIGKRNGVGILLGHKVHGFTAWWLWRLYYLGILPTLEKKLESDGRLGYRPFLPNGM